jgi:GNAT superfamily N-acetyltransferase
VHAGYRKDSEADKAANHAIWEDAERRLWNDPAHDIGKDWFVNNYSIEGKGIDEDVLADRMHFVCAPDGECIATTTAWFAGSPGALGGVVHNVAMKSTHDGKGLSKPLLAAVLKRMKELGHTDCQLGTSAARFPAINLYVKFGFMPLVRSDREYRAWRQLQPLLREELVAGFSPKIFGASAWPPVYFTPKL